MTRQDERPDHSNAAFPPFTDFTGKSFHNASFRGAQFEGKVTFQQAHFTGLTDFSGATFTGPADFNEATFDGDAVFHKATFKDPAKFTAARFNGRIDCKETRFSHDAHFSNVAFNGPGDFAGAEFHAWCRFTASRFAAAAGFSATRFLGSAHFADVAFGADADFTASRFVAYADFSRAQFQGSVLFNGASIECKTIFRDAVFARKSDFSDCRFTNPVNFSAAEFQAAALFERVLFTQFVDFSRARLRDSFVLAPPREAAGAAPEIRFEAVAIEHPERVRFSNISFERITLMGTSLRGIGFENPRWPKRGMFRKRAVVYDEIQKEKPDPEKLAQLYGDIRSNLRTSGATADLGDLLYREMEVRRKQRRSGADSLYFFRRYLSPYTLFWLTCGYGRRPLRAAVFAILAALIFFSR